VRKTIVLADDSKTFLMYMGLLLKRLGFDLLTSRNGQEALRLIKSNPVDLVMLNVYMPTLDGIATLRLIKSDNGIADLPVIMVSADTSPETIKACQDLGCIDFLPKPIKVDQLHEAIQKSFFLQGGHYRKHIRASCIRKITVEFRGDRLQYYTETFSEGGVYVRTENPLPVGSDVAMTLVLDDGERRRYKGKVIYVKKEVGDFSTLSPGMAIQFTELSTHDNLKLKSFMKGLIAGDILGEQGDYTYLEP
jgi:CheY-like chemotaxis protein/Tfp pilus assembly protein PilZ